MSHQTEVQLKNGATITSQAFAEAHNRYRPRLLNNMTAVIRNRDEAEDVTATAFAAAFENLGQFRGESSLETWVHAIAMNEAINRRRRSGWTSASLDAEHAPEPTEPDLLIQKLERSECCARVRKALRAVPLMYRRELLDHFVHGLSAREMAATRRIPVGTVLSRLFKAKQLLRSAWNRVGFTVER